MKTAENWLRDHRVKVMIGDSNRGVSMIAMRFGEWTPSSRRVIW